MSGQLDHSPADILRRAMVDMQLCTLPSESGTSNWPAYTSQEPDTPDNCITTYDTTPIHQGRFHYNGEVQERYGIQIRLRTANHRKGWKKIQDLAIALDEDLYRRDVFAFYPDDPANTDSTLCHYRIQAISRTSGPLSIGKETPESKRDIFTLNVTATIRQDPPKER